MTPLILVRSHQFYPFTGFMERSGMPLNRLLEQHRLPVRMLESPSLFLDESRFCELIEKIGQSEGLPDFGHRVGRTLKLDSLGDFGALILGQPTLYRAINVTASIVKSEAPFARFGLQPHGDNYLFYLHREPNVPRTPPVLELYNLQLLLKIVQATAGGNWKPRTVGLMADHLPSGFRPEEVCTDAIQLRSWATTVEIPEHLLAKSMDAATPEKDLSNDLEQAYAQRRDTPVPDFATSIVELMKGYIHQKLSTHDLGGILRMSERTLQRKLKSAGYSYQMLADRSRFEVARELLNDPSISITDVAYMLGYSDIANFSRAFKRWAGMCPQKFRKLDS